MAKKKKDEQRSRMTDAKQAAQQNRQNVRYGTSATYSTGDTSKKSTRQAAVDIARGAKSVGSVAKTSAKSSNSSINTKKSPQTAQRVSQGASNNTRTSYTPQRDGHIPTTVQNSYGVQRRGTTTTSGRTSGRGDRKQNVLERTGKTLKGSVKQFAGGHLSSIGSNLQTQEVTARSIHNAKADNRNDSYKLRSRADAEKREQNFQNTINKKEGVDTVKALEWRDRNARNPLKSIKNSVTETAKAYNNARTEKGEQSYSLRSREEAEKTRDSMMANIGRKEGVDIRNVERPKKAERPNEFPEFDEYSPSQKLIRTGDELIESGSKDIERAKAGAGAVGRFLIDAGANATQMALDRSVGAIGDLIVPGMGTALSMGSLMNRAGGTASYDARQKGSDPDQQFRYALGVSLVEGLSEGVFNSVSAFRSTYGAGAFDLADRVSKRVAASNIVRNYFNSPAGRSFIINASRLGAQGFEEGSEEVIADIIEPLLEKAITGSSDGIELKQMIYDFMVGAFMGAVPGTVDVARNVRTDSAIQNAMSEGRLNEDEYINRGLIQGRTGKNATNAELLAKELQEQKAQGKEVLPSQMRMLMEANAEAESSNTYEFRQRKADEFNEALKSGKTGTVERHYTAEEQEAIGRVRYQKEAEFRKEAKDRMGEDSSETSQKAVARVLSGSAETDDIDTILLDENARKAVEDIEKVVLPEDHAEAREVLENLAVNNQIANEDTTVSQAHEEIRNSMSQRNGEFFDEHYDEAIEALDVPNGAEIYDSVFSRLYTDGTVKESNFDESYDRIVTDLANRLGDEVGGRISNYFDKSFAEQIFNRGRDAMTEDNLKSAAKSQSFKYAETPGKISFEGNARKMISDRQADLLGKFAERANVHIKFMEKILTEDGGEANGMYKNGVIYIAANSDNKFIVVAKHELTHHLKATAFDSYKELEDFVFQKQYESNAEALENRIRWYQKNFGYTPEEAREEIIADASEAFFTDEGAIQDAVSFSEKLGKAIHDGIHTLLDTFISLQDTETDFSRRQTNAGDFLKTLDILKDAEQMWLKALDESVGRGKNAETVSKSELKAIEGKNLYSIKGNKARWTEDRIDRLIHDNGAKFEEDYSYAYATLMNPRDFLKLTVDDKYLGEWLKESQNVPEELKGMSYRDKVNTVWNRKQETGKWLTPNKNYPLDTEELKNNNETPYLSIDSIFNNEVDAHEGRHRMRALMEAGVESVPIVIRDTATRRYKVPKSSLVVSSQHFSNGKVNNGAEITLTDLIPINEKHRDELIEKFGGEADVKFSRKPMKEKYEDDEKLTHSQFNSWYSAHKLDLRGRGNIQEQIESIKANGFVGDGGFMGNIMSAGINDSLDREGLPRSFFKDEKGWDDEKIDSYLNEHKWVDDVYYPNMTVSDQRYGVRKGETVLLVPRPWTDQKFGRVKQGFKPREYEIVTAERNFQPYYELYEKAYDQAHAKFSKKDQDYMDAVNRGDMETAQRMVDEQAKRNGYNLAMYHGTGEFFNVFNRGSEGIHIGNKEQATQVARYRYNDRSKSTRYTWEDIKKNINTMTDADKERMITTVRRLSSAVTAYNGDISNNKDFINYMDSAIQKVDEGSANPTMFRVSTFDRKVGENLMSLYAKINNPFVINDDVQGWYPNVVADIILLRSHGKTTYRSDYYLDGVYDISGEPITLSKENEDRLYEVKRGNATTEEGWDTISDVLKNSGGYDGIKYLNKFEGNRKDYSYIALKPSDVKSADPVTYDDNGDVIPLSERFNEKNDDIRYSRKDSDGNTLSEGQAEYFKDSKVRDKDGNLLVMYHGTQKKGFTVFNPSESQDGISLFFTDKLDVAKGYSGVKKTYAPKIEKPTLAKVQKALDKEDDGYHHYKVAKTDNGYEVFRFEYDWNLGEDGEWIRNDRKVNDWFNYEAKSLEDIANYIKREFSNADESTNYKVYLNLVNPLIVNADGRYFDELGDLSKGLEDTRAYAEYAKKNGYDGVIFKDIIDTALFASNEERFEASNVVIAFSSNQIKSVANKNPTENPDIRYSRKKDQAYLDAVNRGDMETAQRMVDEEAKKHGYNSPKLYHGTTTFGWTKPMLQSGNETRGGELGVWTATTPESVRYYSGEASSVREIGHGNTQEEIEYTRWWNEAFHKPDDGKIMADGIYQFYGNLDGFLDVKPDTTRGASAFGFYYNGKKYTSVDMAEYAKENGYKGVHIDSILDGNYYTEEYIFFEPWTQLKSADPVTYDDNGDVIPLSERFNEKNDDIRYSKKATNEELASRDDTAIFINNTSKVNYIGMILNGQKTEETRARRTLDKFIGKEKFVTDGKRVFGTITLGEPHKYTSEEFHTKEAQRKHRVPKGDEYDIQEGKTKWAYPIESYKKFAKPLKLSNSSDYVGSRQARQVVFSEKEMPPVATLDKSGAIVETQSGNPVAKFEENGSVQFSLKTYDTDGRQLYRDYLKKMVKKGDLTQQEADDMYNELETIYRINKELADSGKYAPFTAWSEADVITGENGKPVFSSVKKNSEYKMNIDFSTICKKRRTLDAVFRDMINRGLFENLDLNKDESAALVVNINDLIRKYDFEAACSLCFVEARRYRQQQTATTFRDMWNGLVESMYKDKSKIAYFNYGEDKTVKDVPNGIHTMQNADLDLSHVKAVATERKDGKLVQTAEAKAARLILEDPSQRRLMRIGDMMASTGFENMQIQNPKLMKIYNAKKGTGGAKSSFGDVQYLNEIIRSRSFTRKSAYAVSGVRIQSFSDYVPRMVFDYVQVIGDLAAKKLPAHAYTKEVLFVKQFGLTGVKINMSLVPDVVKGGIAPGLDKDGNYVWNTDGTFPFDEAIEIQKAEGYKENCGTIAVGISNEQILKMLADPEIQMVIPYHSSSLNPLVAAMTNVDRFTDYTDYQNTKDAEGKTVAKDFDWDNKLYKLSHSKDGKLLPKSEWGDIQELVKEYVDWCEERNYTPKFSQFLYQREGNRMDGKIVTDKDGNKVINPGYYKMLEDFALLDNDGNFKPQDDVKLRFPTEDSAFGSMASLIEEGLSEDTKLEARRDNQIGNIVDEIEGMMQTEEGKRALTQKSVESDILSKRFEKDDSKLSRKSDDDILDKYIADRQKRIDDGEQMSFFGSLNETLPSKPKTKTRAEKFYDNVLKTIANIQKKGSWSGMEVKGLFLQYPEFNFIERLNNKSDDTAEADFKAFLSMVSDVKDLGNYKWYFSAYEWNSEWKKRNRSGKMKFNKLIENRAEEIKAGKAGGRDVGIKKKEYTPKEIRQLFNELNTDKELKALGKKVFDCIDKNFDVKYQGVSNIKGFDFTSGGTLGEAGGRTVHLNMKYFNSGAYTDQQKASTLLHESIHAVTVYALNLYHENPDQLSPEIGQACVAINTAYDTIKDDPSFKGQYGLKNAREMVAELSNPVFRAKLKAKNIYTGIVKAIKKLLGITDSGDISTYRVVNDALEQILNNADAVSFEKFANKVSARYNGKFSRKESTSSETLSTQNTIAKLEEQVKDLKAEFKRTNLKTANQKDVRIQAGRLIQRHGSNMQAQTSLMDTFNKIFSLYKEKGTDAFDEVYEIARDEAVNIVNNIGVIHNEGAEEYKAIKQYLRETPIQIDEAMKRNITDYNDFRKRNFGRLKLVNGETSNIDNVYMELAELFPAQFTEDYINPHDQLNHIVDVLDNYAPFYESLDGASEEMQDYVVDIAADIMETAYNLQTKKTFADRKYEEKVKAVAKAREEALASRNKALDRQKERYEKKLDTLKEKHQDYKADTRENAEKKRRIKQISNVYKRLLEKLQTPSDTKHLPDGYAPVVSNVLKMFDFTTPGMEKWAERHGEPSKRYKYMIELRKQLEQMSKDEGSELEVDPDLLDLVDEIIADMGENQRLIDMDSKTLEDIAVLFRAFEHQVNSYNKAFDEANKKTVSDTAHSIFDHLNETKKSKWHLGIMGRLLTSNFNPSDFFELVGGDIANLYNATRLGFDKYVDRLDNAKTFLQDMVDNKKADKWANHLNTFKTSAGEEIQLTDTQLMSLYCLNKREQAQGHIYVGGIVSAPLKVRSKNKITTKELEKTRVIPTVDDIGRWFDTLTDEQKRVADSIQRYFVDEVSDWGNETSMKLYNYKKFGEENYFPIQSSSDYMASNFDQRGNDPVLKNMGMTKALTKNASNAIVVDDIFTVYSKHVAQMASYNAYVPAITDFQRVWNYTEGNDQDMVKARFERVYGKQATKYIDNFFKNLNGVYKANFDPTILDKGLGLFKKAAVGGNIRVLVQQPTAIARSALIINPAYLTAAVPLATAQPKKTYKEMMDHCPIARWKTWGFYSSDITSASRDLRNIMIGKDALTDKIFMDMYGTADNVTWTVIFKACELQVEAQNKGLKKGSDEYWEKVNELASRVFDRTQVVDSPFHRSEIMKSQNGITKMVTAFMAEPTKTINMINTELTKAATELKNGHPARATGIFVRVGAVITANAAALAMAQALVDAMRHAGGDDDKDKGDYEFRFKNYWKSNFADNLNPLGMIPYVKDIKSQWEGYDVLRMDMNGVQKVVQSIQYLQKYYEDPSASKYSAQEEWTNLALSTMYAIGVPVSNAKRDIEGLYVSIMEGTGHPEVFFHQAQRKYQVNDKTKGTFVDMYYDALKGGNKSLANEIHRYLIKNGITEDYIEQRKRTWKKHQSSDDE